MLGQLTAPTTADADHPAVDTTAAIQLGSEPAAHNSSTESVQLANLMLHDVGSSTDKAEMLVALARTMAKRVAATAIVHFERTAGGALTDQPRQIAGTLPSSEVLVPRLQRMADQACRNGAAQQGRLGTRFGNAVLVPIVYRDQQPEAIGAVVPPESSQVGRTTEVLQFAAAHITLWHVLQTSLKAEKVAKHSAALLDLLGRMEATSRLEEACTILANDVQRFLDCRQIIVATRRGKRHPCRVQAVSGLPDFDRHAHHIQQFEQALEEIALQGQYVEQPSPAGHASAVNRTLTQLQETIGCQALLGAPLADEQGESIGAWLVVDPPAEPRLAETRQFVRAASRQVGACIRVIQRATPGPVARLFRSGRSTTPRWRVWVAAVSVVAVVALMCVPFSHRIRCDCTLQPAVRRFVAAPFDGVLRITRVRPGQSVSKGQILAELDGRDIRLQLAALRADLERATKQWEAALSTEAIADAQQAALEKEKLAKQIQLLEDHEAHLLLRSPIDGIVVSGDLENSQGVPVTVGQALYEIAPAGRMTAEVDIPESQVRFVETGMTMQIRLDAFPAHPRRVKIATIIPRAQPRDDALVFVAKTALDADGDALRPGMSGRATVVAPARRLGWLLFHRPVESLLMTLGW